MLNKIINSDGKQDFIGFFNKVVIQEFIFITPTEVFVAYVKVVILAAFFVCFPVVLFESWAFLAPALSAATRRMVVVWLFFALICFFGGVAFAYGILLPAAR